MNRLPLFSALLVCAFTSAAPAQAQSYFQDDLENLRQQWHEAQAHTQRGNAAARAGNASEACWQFRKATSVFTAVQRRAEDQARNLSLPREAMHSMRDIAKDAENNANQTRYVATSACDKAEGRSKPAAPASPPPPAKPAPALPTPATPSTPARPAATPAPAPAAAAPKLPAPIEPTGARVPVPGLARVTLRLPEGAQFAGMDHTDPRIEPQVLITGPNMQCRVRTYPWAGGNTNYPIWQPSHHASFGRLADRGLGFRGLMEYSLLDGAMVAVVSREERKAGTQRIGVVRQTIEFPTLAGDCEVTGDSVANVGLARAMLESLRWQGQKVDGVRSETKYAPYGFGPDPAELANTLSQARLAPELMAQSLHATGAGTTAYPNIVKVGLTAWRPNSEFAMVPLATHVEIRRIDAYQGGATCEVREAGAWDAANLTQPLGGEPAAERLAAAPGYAEQGVAQVDGAALRRASSSQDPVIRVRYAAGKPALLVACRPLHDEGKKDVAQALVRLAESVRWGDEAVPPK